MALFNEVRLVANIVKDPLIYDGEKSWAVIRVASNTGKKESKEALFIDIKLFDGAFRDLKSFDLKKGDLVSIKGTESPIELTYKREELTYQSTLRNGRYGRLKIFQKSG